MADCCYHTLAGTFLGAQSGKIRAPNRWVLSCTKFYYLVRRKKEVRLHDGVQLRANVSPVSSLCSGCTKQQQRQKEKHTVRLVSQGKKKPNRQTSSFFTSARQWLTSVVGYSWAAHASECKNDPHAFPPSQRFTELQTHSRLEGEVVTLADETKQLRCRRNVKAMMLVKDCFRLFPACFFITIIIYCIPPSSIHSADLSPVSGLRRGTGGTSLKLKLSTQTKSHVCSTV